MGYLIGAGIMSAGIVIGWVIATARAPRPRATQRRLRQMTADERAAVRAMQRVLRGR